MTDQSQPSKPSHSPRPRRRWYRDPFIVFLVIGALLFLIDAWRGDSGADRSIVVDEAEVARLSGLWQAQSGRPPTLEELEGLVRATVREEVLFREAVRLGLDRDDTIVRRRLAQKMEFLLDDTSAPEEPSEDALRAWFDDRVERYAEPERWSFRHVFYSIDRRGEETAAAAARTDLARLTDSDTDWRALGDPFMLQREYGERTSQDVMELFGRRFATALAEAESPTGVWFGPVRSALGLHLVEIVSHRDSHLRPFEEVAATVREDWARERQRQANLDAYESLREQYEVEIAPLPELAAAGERSATAQGSPQTRGQR